MHHYYPYYPAYIIFIVDNTPTTAPATAGGFYQEYSETRLVWQLCGILAL